MYSHNKEGCSTSSMFDLNKDCKRFCIISLRKKRNGFRALNFSSVQIKYIKWEYMLATFFRHIFKKKHCFKDIALLENMSTVDRKQILLTCKMIHMLDFLFILQKKLCLF